MALAVGASPAAAAEAPNVIQRIVVEVIKTGKIDVCNYTPEELKKVKSQIPVDQEQYKDLSTLVDDAIAERAQGKCDKKKSTAPSVADQSAAPPASGQAPPSDGSAPQGAAPQTATPSAGAPAQAQAPPAPTAEPSPAASIASDDSIALASNSTDIATDTPFPVLLLAILAGLLALGAMAFGFVRWFAWEPAWAVRWRHCTGEASRRASATFAEFADFVRLGR